MLPSTSRVHAKPALADVSVLIVGAGPAGLMTAVALARHGVERRRDSSSLPRATAISTRSMELLRAWGLEDEIRAGGTDVEWLQWYCETLAQAPSGEGRPTGFPTRAQSAVISPVRPACVPQDHLEPVLLRHLRAAGDAALRPRIERIGRFTFAAQMAERFRSGSAFLVGDAAHRATPRGGTGRNTAIHDGYDLGWKLAWVLRGWAAPALLDSYEAERRPVSEHNVARSADPNGTARAAEQELHADLGGRIAHTWVPSAGGRVSTLDLLQPGLTLLTGPQHERWRAAAEAIAPAVPLGVERLRRDHRASDRHPQRRRAPGPTRRHAGELARA